MSTAIHASSVVAGNSSRDPNTLGCRNTHGLAYSVADEAIARVADKADDLIPGWCEKACQALRKFARTRGVMFTVEQARLILASQLPRPHDDRCWGKVTAMALKRGYIEPVKGLYFPTVSSNGSVRAVYRGGVNANARSNAPSIAQAVPAQSASIA